MNIHHPSAYFFFLTLRFVCKTKIVAISKSNDRFENNRKSNQSGLRLTGLRLTGNLQRPRNDFVLNRARHTAPLFATLLAATLTGVDCNAFSFHCPFEG